MATRSDDWWRQGLRDLEQARASREEERHEWACFAANQADADSIIGFVRSHLA